MTVTVRYYAVLREITGTGVESLQIPDGSDGHTLLRFIAEKHEKLGPYLSSIRLAGETEFIENKSVLEPDKVISLIPPVSGG